MSIPLLPNDPHDDRLRAAVRPPDWVNPTPTGRYNLVVIGGGPAGLVCAAGAAGLGAKVALVERDLLGGDCLTVGCVPSKTLLRAAKAAHEIRTAKRFGLTTGEPEIDFAAVMERVRRVRAEASVVDSAERFKGLGVDVFLGDGTFVDGESVRVNGVSLTFAKCVIATGARAKRWEGKAPAEPKILTNESLFTLTELPRRLLVVGAGPVGCEMAQAFARLGSRVTLVAKGGRVLPKELPEAAELVATSFRADGVTVVSDAPPFADFDAVLLATGRAPNVESLNLAAAGIALSGDKGVLVDEHLRTTNRRIFAAGDVTSLGVRFTHAADAMARVVLRNALFAGRVTFDPMTIPRCTFTDPEVAAVGDTGTGNGEWHLDFQHLDRANTDGAGGFLKVFTAARSDRLLGAVCVGPNAGELIGTVSATMSNRIGLSKLANVVFPYPTYTEAIRKLADQFNRGKLTPLVQRLFRTWLRWGR